KHYFSQGVTHLLVPQNSIIANNEERFVWLVRGDSVVKQVVELGKNTNDGYTVVTQGVAKGDLVVKTGMQNLKADSKIRVIQGQNAPESVPTPHPQGAQ
ncbi:MAG: efflux RND transporter periplasmic adaptor subunit, partial [Shewanella sp.]